MSRRSPSAAWRTRSTTGWTRLTRRGTSTAPAPGNTLNVDRREVLRLIMDSLRYWVTEMHVDGFRFDLATTLARDTGSFDRLSAFFDLVYQDPVINRVKLIAEPWDVNLPDSYQAGRFPRGWAEWNDRYRDDVRDFWRRRGSVAALGYRLTGSADLYAAGRRGPSTSINYLTSHDGKTLRDLVTYERKHNDANGENNRDGIADDRADNFGIEGPTDDEQVLSWRSRQQRNLMATLLLSQGVPMILGGDECCRTQLGNNNSYCQDNEISWYDWSVKNGQDFTEFTRHLIALNRSYRTLRRPTFLTGSGDPPDIAWFDALGRADGRRGLERSDQPFHRLPAPRAQRRAPGRRRAGGTQCRRAGIRFRDARRAGSTLHVPGGHPQRGRSTGGGMDGRKPGRRWSSPRRRVLVASGPRPGT